jgi:hydroxybutyrate-dimer hydrolase
VGLNAFVEGNRSRLSYVEVMHANHFDIFSSVTPLFIVPLNLYFHRALDAMYAHLRDGVPLPPSQVVRAVPRISGLVPMTDANVPAIRQRVGAGDAIVRSARRLDIPD